MQTVILSACHRSSNLQNAQAEFVRTWRLNRATDRREYGFRLARSWGADFGSIDFFFNLPTGNQYVERDLEWRDLGAAYAN